MSKRSEHSEQVAFFEWCALNVGRHPELQWIFAIPNGTRTSISIAAKMKREGVRKGVSDIFLPHPVYPYHGLFIEAKLSKRSNKSKEQREFIAFAKGQGYYATFAHGCDEMIAITESYLDGLL